MDARTIARLLEYFDIREFFHNNSPLRLAIIWGIMVLMAIAVRFICAIFQKKLEKYVASRPGAANAAGKAADRMDFKMFERVIRNVRRILYLLVLYWGLSRMIIGPEYAQVINILFTALCIWACIEFFIAFVPFNIDLYLRGKGATLDTSQSRSLMPIIKGLIWAVGLTFLLDNLGFHVSTIIAGLGIVGVAVGLAGQAILADFFSYIVILLDKPFRIGDFVEVGEGKKGEVEYMGPKTTHLRSLEDDLIVCANSEMTRGVIVNQGRTVEREVLLSVGVAYDTALDKIRNLPEIFKEVVQSVPQCKFDRACLLSFGNSNLQYQILYFVTGSKVDARKFMTTQSLVNVAILERFAREGINMAFPTEHVLFTDLDKPAQKEIAAGN